MVFGRLKIIFDFYCGWLIGCFVVLIFFLDKQKQIKLTNQINNIILTKLNYKYIEIKIYNRKTKKTVMNLMNFLNKIYKNDEALKSLRFCE